MPTIAERFERLLTLGICEDTPDNRALFAAGFSAVLHDLLMAKPRQRTPIRRQLWDELHDFICNSERDSPVVRQRFDEMRQSAANAGII